jgi:transcriptional regulator GlxA family with amidase domain
VVLLAGPNTQIVDLAGPAEVFARTAAVLAGRPTAGAGYRLEVVSTTGGMVTTSCGISFVSHGRYDRLHGAIDTLLIVGGPDLPTATPDPAVVRWLQRMSRRVRRIGSVCTGAFLLAAAGLLANRRMTTHWQWCAVLRAAYPDVIVEPDRIFVRDGAVYTSAGITAGMDLALALVEDDHGADVALQIARELVLFLRRPGGQSQFSTALTLQGAPTASLRELQAWLVDHLHQPLTVEQLAERVSMSPRNFARVFLRDMGLTPARFVERLRVDAARRRLEETGETLEDVCVQCGFGSVDSLRRAFVRVLGTRPQEYRRLFRTMRSGSPRS